MVSIRQLIILAVICAATILITSCGENKEKEINTSNKNMNNIIAYFEIQSSNPVREMEFYKAVFGWQFTKLDNLPADEYYRITTDGISGGLHKRFVNTPPMECGTNAFICSIQVENFDETSERILKAGGQIAYPKFAIAGFCWQGYFIDADNNTFGVFELDAKAK